MLLPYLIMSECYDVFTLHFDVIMLWCQYFMMLPSIITSLHYIMNHYIMTLCYDIIMLHCDVIVFCYYPR